MSKRSRDASFSPAPDRNRSPAVEDEFDALAGHAPPAKFSQISPDAASSQPVRVMQCSLAPHREAVCFGTQEDYEIHYLKEHTNRCATCSKNFPSPRFLDLHIEENHNALREALAARGEKTYRCFVEDCDRKCSTPQKRRLHLIDKHMFPKTYNFRIIDQGIDKAVSMLREGRRRRVSTADDNRRGERHQRRASDQLRNPPFEIGEETSSALLPGKDIEGCVAKADPMRKDAPTGTAARDESVEDLPDGLDSITHSLSSLRFVPSSVFRNQNKKSANLQHGDPNKKPNVNEKN